jgi:hypothetical protein
MRPIQEKARRGSGGRCGAVGVRRAKSSAPRIGWLLVKGERECWTPVRAVRRVFLHVRPDAIVGVESVRGARTPRVLLTVAHDGGETRVCVDGTLLQLAARLASVSEGGAA